MLCVCTNTDTLIKASPITVPQELAPCSQTSPLSYSRPGALEGSNCKSHPPHCNTVLQFFIQDARSNPHRQLVWDRQSPPLPRPQILFQLLPVLNVFSFEFLLLFSLCPCSHFDSCLCSYLFCHCRIVTHAWQAVHLHFMLPLCYAQLKGWRIKQNNESSLKRKQNQ